MAFGGYQVRAAREAQFRNKIGLVVLGLGVDEKSGVREVTHIGEPIVLKPVSDNLTPTRHTMTMEPETAQILMDDLWDCGIRPTEGAGSAGAMAAVKEHLADMRKIAFKKLQMSE